MAKRKKSLNELAAEIRDVIWHNGWDLVMMEHWEDPKHAYMIPAKLALIHSEVSEALEAYRNHDMKNFQEEMADIVIRVLDCVGGLTLDFSSVVDAKIDTNRNRGFHHGGKRV